MNYLIPLFDCVVVSEKAYHLKKGVKYQVCENGLKHGVVFGQENNIPYLFDLKENNLNVLKINYFGDTYFFLKPNYYSSNFSTKIKFKTNDIEINLSHELKVSINRELKCEKLVENLNFSHHEINGELCLIYFTGKRNFVVVIKNDEIVFAEFYDECNNNEKEKYFMCRKHDCLNHGKVCHIKENEVSSYLVYLDNEDLNLKMEFLPHVFLDCVKSENHKYANQLLTDNLKLKDESSIKDFFAKFDDFYPLKQNVFVLLNKNALAGIVEFEVENNAIKNIKIHQDFC